MDIFDLNDDNIIQNLLEYLKKTTDEKILNKIKELVEDAIDDIENNTERKNFEENFPDINLDYFSFTEDNDTRSINVEFSYKDVEDIGYSMKCKCIDSSKITGSSRDYILRAKIDGLGSFSVDADDKSPLVNNGPDYRNYVPAEKQELFDEVILYLIGICTGHLPCNDYITKNPFGYNNEIPEEFHKEAYRLAESMNLKLITLTETHCAVIEKFLNSHGTEYDVYDLDEYKRGLMTTDNVNEFVLKLISLRRDILEKNYSDKNSFIKFYSNAKNKQKIFTTLIDKNCVDLIQLFCLGHEQKFILDYKIKLNQDQFDYLVENFPELEVEDPFGSFGIPCGLFTYGIYHKLKNLPKYDDSWSDNNAILTVIHDYDEKYLEENVFPNQEFYDRFFDFEYFEGDKQQIMQKYLPLFKEISPKIKAKFG